MKVTVVLLDAVKLLLWFQLRIFIKDLGLIPSGDTSQIPQYLSQKLSFFFINLDSAIHHWLRKGSSFHQRPPQGRDEKHTAASVLFLCVRALSGIRLSYILNTLLK